MYEREKFVMWFFNAYAPILYCISFRALIFQLLRSPVIDSRYQFRQLCSLAGRCDNPIPSRFLAPIDCLKFPAQVIFIWSDKTPLQYSSLLLIEGQQLPFISVRVDFFYTSYFVVSVLPKLSVTKCIGKGRVTRKVHAKLLSNRVTALS
jgi:hypothetical protein